MSLTIEVYYSFQSPYSYLALESIYNLEERFDVTLLWQPFSAKAAGQPVPPTPIIPDKLQYLLEDTKRYADDHGIPLKYPDGWPENEFDPGRSIRGALIAQDLEVLKEYNYKVSHKWWGLGENPNDENFTTELCDELDIDLGEFLSKVSSSDTRERVKGVHKRGKKYSIFDTPTLLIENERFVGIDKVTYVEWRLMKLGLAKKAAA